METELSPAEELPALYRAILDGVARLEGIGQRREAARARSEATAIYSSSWDSGGRKRLLRLHHRIERIIDPVDRSGMSVERVWRPLQRSAGTR